MKVPIIQFFITRSISRKLQWGWVPLYVFWYRSIDILVLICRGEVSENYFYHIPIVSSKNHNLEIIALVIDFTNQEPPHITKNLLHYTINLFGLLCISHIQKQIL